MDMKRLVWTIVIVLLATATSCGRPARHSSLEDAIGSTPRVQEDGYQELIRLKAPDGEVLLYEIDKEEYRLLGYKLFKYDSVLGWHGVAEGESLAPPSKLWVYKIRDSQAVNRDFVAVYGQTFTDSISKVRVVFDNDVYEQVDLEGNLFIVASGGVTEVCEIIGLNKRDDEIIREILSRTGKCK